MLNIEFRSQNHKEWKLEDDTNGRFKEEESAV